MSFQPQEAIACRRIYPRFLPPGGLVTAAMHLAMMAPHNGTVNSSLTFDGFTSNADDEHPKGDGRRSSRDGQQRMVQGGGIAFDGSRWCRAGPGSFCHCVCSQIIPPADV